MSAVECSVTKIPSLLSGGERKYLQSLWVEEHMPYQCTKTGNIISIWNTNSLWNSVTATEELEVVSNTL
jgi:hypothetical protein